MQKSSLFRKFFGINLGQSIGKPLPFTFSFHNLLLRKLIQGTTSLLLTRNVNYQPYPIHFLLLGTYHCYLDIQCGAFTVLYPYVATRVLPEPLKHS